MAGVGAREFHAIGGPGFHVWGAVVTVVSFEGWETDGGGVDSVDGLALGVVVEIDRGVFRAHVIDENDDDALRLHCCSDGRSDGDNRGWFWSRVEDISGVALMCSFGRRVSVRLLGGASFLRLCGMRLDYVVSRFD